MGINIDISAFLRRDWDQKKLEKLIFIMFGAWGALPVLMSLFCLAWGSFGGFGPASEHSSAFVYFTTISVNLWAFRVLGIITIAAALVIFCRFIGTFTEFRNFRAHSCFYILAALMAWAFLCLCLSDRPFDQFIGYEIISDGYFTYLVYASLFICASLLRSEALRRKLLLMFCGVMVFLSLILFAQNAGIPFIVYCFPTIRAAVFFNTNYFGYVLCMSVVILFSFYLFDENAGKKTRFIYLLLMTEQMITLLINNTFGSILAVFASIPIAYLVYVKRNGRITAGRLVPAVIIFGLSAFHYIFSSNDFTRLITDVGKVVTDAEDAGKAGSGRWEIWVDAIHRIADRPIFGFGPEGFWDDFRYETSGPPHNEFLQLIGYLGFPGAILYFSAAAQLAVHLWKRRHELSVSTLVGAMAVVCFFVSDFFGHPEYNTTIYFWMFYGLITLESEENTPFLLVNAVVDEKTESKPIRHFGIALTVYVMVCIAVGIPNNLKKTENLYEVMDLMAMNNAEMAVRMKLRNDEIPEHAEFWYDADSYELLPADGPKPSSCGSGTARKGHGHSDYVKRYGTAYEYDESKDYTDSAVWVCVDQDDITVCWVELK